MNNARKIIHIDMDAFFASVEQRDNPRFRGKPLVVGGNPDSRGVVAAASYEARQYGIRSAIPCSQAHRLCPHAIFVRPRFEAYRAVSQQIRAIFHEYTDLVEPLSLDEAYLDVTENHMDNPSATLVANEIRKRIWETTHLTASAGAAPNKFLAKIASDVNKPNGIFVITPDQVEPFIEKLPIGRFYGIGKATEKKMLELGIHNGADLKARTEADLMHYFGKAGAFYYRIARGIDERPVQPHQRRKSVGVEETFARDLADTDDMEQELVLLAESLYGRLKKARVAGKTITLKVRFENFQSITRSKTIPDPTDEKDLILSIGKELLRQTEAGTRRVRLLGLTVSNLNNDPEKDLKEIQLPLPFGNWESD